MVYSWRGNLPSENPDFRDPERDPNIIGIVLDACPDIVGYPKGKKSTWRDLPTAAAVARSTFGISCHRWHMSSMITDHHLQHKLDLIFDTSSPGYCSRTALKAAGLLCVIAHEQRYRHVTLRHLQEILNSSGRGLETTLSYLFDRKILRTQSLRLEHDGINRTNVYSVSCSTVQHHQALDSQVSPHSQRHPEIHNRFLSTSPRKVSWQVFLRAIGLYHVILRMRASGNLVTLQGLATFLKTRSKNPLVDPLQFLSKHDFIEMTLKQVPGQISREYRIDVHPAESRHMSFVLQSLEERLAAHNHSAGLLARQMNKNAIDASVRRVDGRGLSRVVHDQEGIRTSQIEARRLHERD